MPLVFQLIGGYNNMFKIKDHIDFFLGVLIYSILQFLNTYCLVALVSHWKYDLPLAQIFATAVWIIVGTFALLYITYEILYELWIYKEK